VLPGAELQLARRKRGKAWTATLPTLQLLRDFGVDPRSEPVRRAVARARECCRWEHAGEPFFNGEVEPCINGRVVALCAYFDQDVDGVVSRLVCEQLDDSGWNCEAENGSDRSSFATTINVLEGLLQHERATGGFPESRAARRRAEEYLLERKLLRRKSTGEFVNHAWLRASRVGSTTCCARSNTSARPGMRRTLASTKRSRCFDPSSSPMAAGCWRTLIPARSIFRSRTATVGPAGGIRFGQGAFSAGTSRLGCKRGLAATKRLGAFH
jgi:hypothetical protein